MFVKIVVNTAGQFVGTAGLHFDLLSSVNRLIHFRFGMWNQAAEPQISEDGSNQNIWISNFKR